jgi:hypothetical protein
LEQLKKLLVHFDVKPVKRLSPEVEHLRHFFGLVVSSEQEHFCRVLELQRKQVGHYLDAELPAVNVVA